MNGVKAELEDGRGTGKKEGKRPNHMKSPFLISSSSSSPGALRAIFQGQTIKDLKNAHGFFSIGPLYIYISRTTLKRDVLDCIDLCHR